MLTRVYLHARDVMQQLLADLRRLTAPLLAAWARFAIERWERMRAYFAAHPDLADLDDWLDRWYSFGAA
jgi:hypothetical protein